MKKILHISKYYLPHTGGIEDVCYNIVSSMSSEDEVEQQVICFNDSQKTIYDQYEGIRVVRVGYTIKIASQAVSVSYRKELKKILQSFRPDVIHIHVPNPLVVFYLLPILSDKVKLVVHWHSDIVAQKKLYMLVKHSETKLLKRADMIIATSPNYIEGSKPLFAFKNKTIVLQNIINPVKFQYTEKIRLKVEQIKEKYNGRPIVLFVGRHVPYKGIQYLLETTLLVSESCEFLIGGSGPLTESLKDINDASNVHYIGRIPEDDLAAYYYAADVFAFPSITKNEAFGVVLAEAMYCYTPAVTFTIEGSGVNWVNVNNLTGLEVENGNAYQFAQALDRLLKDEILRKKFAEQARKRVEDLFVLERIKDKLKEIYV